MRLCRHYNILIERAHMVVGKLLYGALLGWVVGVVGKLVGGRCVQNGIGVHMRAGFLGDIGFAEPARPEYPRLLALRFAPSVQIT